MLIVFRLGTSQLALVPFTVSTVCFSISGILAIEFRFTEMYYRFIRTVSAPENKVYPYAYCMSVHVCMRHMYVPTYKCEYAIVHLQLHTYVCTMHLYATVVVLVAVCYPM